MTETKHPDQNALPANYVMTLLSRETLWTALLASIQFLSRLPLGGFASHKKPDFQRCAHTFPLAGIAIAAPCAALSLVLPTNGFQAMVVGVLVIGLATIITGALHEDGLADVADGFWGGHSRERKLAIMRDSAIGTYGTLALVFSFIFRVACLAVILANQSGETAFMIILAVASLSRASMVWPWVMLNNARPAKAPETSADSKSEAGLSVIYGEPDHTTLIACALLCLPALVFLIFVSSVVSSAAALLFGGVAVWSMTMLSKRHIGGHTGDTLGATQQMSEMGLYLGLAMFM